MSRKMSKKNLFNFEKIVNFRQCSPVSRVSVSLNEINEYSSFYITIIILQYIL